MKKLVLTTAVALVLSSAAFAQGHHAGGGPSPGGPGGPGGASNFGASHGPSGGPGGNMGPSSMGPGNMAPSNRMGPAPGGNLYNHGQTFNGPQNGGPQSHRFSDRDRMGDRDRTRFSDHNRLNDRDQRLYNRYDRDHDVNRGDRDRNVQGDFRHRGVERGNFFEHGRRFGFRRFWHGQWVFLNDWDDCTAFVWIHVAPGVWAWRPVDVCIG